MSQDGSDNRSASGRPQAWELGALLLILAGALALRLYGVASFPFWEDELYSIHETAGLFWSPYWGDRTIARPLYLLLMNALGPVLPETHLGLRLPAMAFGMASIGLGWLVARTLAGPWAGLVAAVAISMAPGHLFISTINRYWSLVFLLGLVFGWLAVRALEEDHSRGYRRTLAIWMLGAATHPLFLTAVAAFGLGSCLDLSSTRPQWRWPTRNALRFLWLPGLFIVVVAYGLISWTHGSQNVTQIGVAPIEWIQRLRILPGIAFGLTPIVAVGCLLGAWRLRGSVDASAHRWASATLVGVSGVLAILLSLSAFTLVTAIYASALTPLLFVAYGGLCAPAPRAPWPAISGPVLLVLTVAAMLPSTVSQLTDGGRFDLRPALEAIRRADPSLAVVVNPLIQAKHYAPDLKSEDLGEDGGVERLEALQQAETRFWLVLTERRHGISFDHDGRRLAFANRHCTSWGEYGRTRLDFDMFRVRLYLCDR